ncbi:molybdopterin-containing oxidoreductase family protein [Adlercreutzia shanghongiae]|uniref:Molybdopterin-dependent oxidoreductase n=1 Tax=Adlercreutzia shanghongiae TaxID=3111773 RepID=A0ABU6IYK9_9ACTN|nr:molybdopterin-dependent oxidoreductase [Adlercreutzia sp. R22]MEC4294766.1 molybdopterin-dependent oxidoreductase [Adlercreutzia sp. R22]
MSNAKTLSRRGFLKTSAVAGAAAFSAASLAGCAQGQSEELAQTGDSEAAGVEETHHVCCQWATCHNCLVETVVRDGKCVSVRTWAENPWMERPCARGRVWIQRAYNDTRLKYPMRRVGERGSGEWERISWDEAIETIAAEIKKATEAYGPQSIIMPLGAGGMGRVHGTENGNLCNRLQNILGWTGLNPTADDGEAYGQQKVWGDFLYHKPMGMPPGCDTNKVNMVWGYNIGVTMPNTALTLLSEQAMGTKLVVIDPNYTWIASRADLWVPLRPGTDTALMMAMMHVIIEEGLQDTDFLLTQSVAPVLIRQDNLRYLRLSDVTGEERPASDDENVTGGMWFDDPKVMGMANPGYLEDVDPCLVWAEATDEAGSLYEVATPALTGSFTVSGIACRTAFDMLAERVAEFTPEYASEICEVPAETIVELAHLACEKACTYYSTQTGIAYYNMDQTGMATATLKTLTGNVGVQIGDDYWNHVAEEYLAPTGQKSKWVPLTNIYQIIESGMWQGEPLQPKVLFLNGAGSTVGGGADLNRTKRDFLDKMDFIFATDIVMNEGPSYADIVLPASTALEKSDYLPTTNFALRYTDKSIEPLYETKPDGDIIRLLAEALGVGEYFNYTDDEFIDMSLNCEPYLSEGITSARLKSEFLVPIMATYTLAPEKCVLMTKTRRAEFYVDYPAPRFKSGEDYDFDQSHLVRYIEPKHAGKDSPDRDKFPFVVSGEKLQEAYHTQLQNVGWMLETMPEPIVKANPLDMEALSLEDGSYVEVYNNFGHAVAKLVYSEGIRPGMLSCPVGWSSSAFKAGNWVELISSDYDTQTQQVLYQDVAAAIRPWAE